MANNIFQVKRTSTAGRTPNTTGSYATNTQYISAGELALNMTDQILYTSDGTNLITVGSNTINLKVANAITLGNSSVNATINSTTIFLGNNTVNTSINTTSVVLGGTSGVFANTSALRIGGNLNGPLLTTTAVSVLSSSTINTVMNSTSLAVSNSTTSITVSSSLITIGNSSVNASINSTAFSGTANNATNLGGTAASGYQTTAGLASNVATLAANAATYLNGKTESNLNVNSALTSNNSSYLGGTIASGYQTTAGLSANVATLTSNNASYLGGVAAANYVNTSGNYTLSGNVAFNANLIIGSAGDLYINSTSGVWANGSFGTAGQVLTTNSSAVYWSTVTGVNTASQYTWSNTQTFSNTVVINNNKALNFQTVNTSAYATFIQQNDDNFVFYTTNASYGQRAVWAIVANSGTSSFSISTPTIFNANINLGTVAVTANGSVGTAGQLLASNGTATYWVSPGAASVNTAAQFSWSNIHTFSANVNFTGNNITVATNTGSVMFGGAGDTNWRIARNSGATTKWKYSNNTLDILAANSNLEGVVIGNPLSSGATYFETGYLGTFIASNATIGNSSSNATINSTAYTGSANNASYLGGTAAAGYQTTAGLSANVATLAANAATYLNGKTEANLNVNNSVTSNTANTANYIIANTGLVSNSSGVFVNSAYIATLASNTSNTANTANNASNLGGVAAASYVNTSGAYTISGIHTHNANLVIGTTAGISANGSYGTASQVLTSNGTTVYWSTVSSGSGNNYIGYYPVRQIFTANGTVNTFTVTGGYSANNLDVFVNGVKLQNNVEANVQNGSTFTIIPGNPANNSVIEVIGYNLVGSASLPNATFANVNLTGTVNFAAANTIQQTVTYAANTNWDTSQGVIATVTLTGNTNFNNPTNLKVTTYILHIYQDATGGRTATWSSNFKWAAGVAPVLTTNANAHDVLSFISDGTYLYGSFLPNVK